MVTMTNIQKMDYGAAYDTYWQNSDRVGESSGDLGRVADLVSMYCGLGKTLDVGSGEGFLVGELLLKGHDVYGLDVSEVVVARSIERWGNRFTQGSVLSLPYGDGSFHTIVSTDCMEHLAPEDVPSALGEMYRVSSRFVFLQIATTQDRDKHWHLTVEGRAWWESRCFEAGFRKHPSYYHVTPYESLNNDGWQIYVVLEKIPHEALKKYSLAMLDEKRLLHMDMLREIGRRGDAHCVRYHMAAQYIRPGDTVLDVACGLGYGSHILFHNSPARTVLGVDLSEYGIAYAEANYGLQDAVQFMVGDAQKLGFLPDNSVDFITGFETIEHVPSPAEYLSELKRVLRPSGRLMICAPNDWTDETGQDPNPHHLHVYTWNRLFKECGELFLLEKGFAQTAGGAMKLHHSARKWEEVSLQPMLDREAEWAVLLCMADPIDGKSVPYTETTWRIPDSPDFNVSAFARDYENPWLVKGMVAIGMRNQSSDNLRSIRARVIESVAPDSADYGAALCGQAYDMLARDAITEDAYESMHSSILKYAAIKSPSPHQLRWQVSLLFVGAELARKRGDIHEAVSLYSHCADVDVLAYSPLLGNRILDALFWLAMISLNTGEVLVARSHLVRSVKETKRLLAGEWINICGDIEEPLPFGLAEAAQLMDKATRAAYMLAVLEDYSRRPGLFAPETQGFYERLLVWKDRDLSAQSKTIEELTREIESLNSSAQALAREVAEQDRHAQELAREVRRQDEHAQALAREVVEKDGQVRELTHKLEYINNMTIWQHMLEKVKRK